MTHIRVVSIARLEGLCGCTEFCIVAIGPCSSAQSDPNVPDPFAASDSDQRITFEMFRISYLLSANRVVAFRARSIAVPKEGLVQPLA